MLGKSTIYALFMVAFFRNRYREPVGRYRSCEKNKILGKELVVRSTVFSAERPHKQRNHACAVNGNALEVNLHNSYLWDRLV